jgi:hypothetical protein
MTTHKKLTQLYTRNDQKIRLKEFVSENFEGRTKSVSWLAWQLFETMISLEHSVNFEAIKDETSFKREIMKTIRGLDTDQLEEAIEFEVKNKKEGVA